jgi:short-subunit dehydrogenase
MSCPIALITGGSSGIGLSISKELLNRGYRVYSVSRKPERGLENPQFFPLRLDLSEHSKITPFCLNFLKEYGVPELLINNAGCGAFYEWGSFPEEEIMRQVNLLFSSPILMCRTFAPEMAKRSKGIILNMSSLATLYPLPFMPMYNAGKSALSSFTESMMLEYPKYPKFIDFRMGDVKTKFNEVASSQAKDVQPEKMRRAWVQIEKQLDHSPSPHLAAKQVIKSIDLLKSNQFFGGGFIHRMVLPRARLLLNHSLLILILRFYYKIIKH